MSSMSRSLPARVTAAAVAVLVTAMGARALATELEGRGSGVPEILTYGTGTATTYLVDHGDSVSIYAEKVPTDTLIEHMRAVGGPTIESLEPVTRPVTLTMHRARMEEVLRRMLGGYSFTYHYKGGRIANVIVVGTIEGHQHIAPSALVSRAQWTRVELGEGQAAGQRADEGARTPGSSPR